MKLHIEQMMYINNVATLAQIAGIENAIIERGMIRGISDNKTVAILHERKGDGEVELPFESIALSDIKGFINRFNIIVAAPKPTFEATLDETEAHAKVLTMNGGPKTSVEFRCANPIVISAPKNIRDESAFEIDLDANTLSMLSKATTAMDTDIVVIKSDKKSAALELKDINGSHFSHSLGAKPKLINGAKDQEFSFRYDAKLLQSLLKASNQSILKIGGRGVLNLIVNGINVFVLPMV